MFSVRSRDTALGIILALGVSVVLNLPLWHALIITDEARRPDVISESSDEEFYLTRIREVADGHTRAGHPYLYERRDQAYPLGNFWEVIVSSPMRLGFSLKTTSLMTDAVFPFLLALLLWIAVRPILPQRRWRTLLIFTLFLGWELFWWKRPISPQATMVLPLLYFWAFFHLKRETLWLTIIRSALIGLMIHSYSFHWTYCLGAEGLLTLLLLATDETWAMRLKRVAAAAIPFLLIASPWILMMLSLHGNVEYAQTLERLGMLRRRFPAGIVLQLFILGAGLLTLLARRTSRDKDTSTGLFVLLGAGLVMLNQMLITGQEAEFSSHYRQIIFFPLWIAVIWSCSILLRSQVILSRVIPVVALIVVGVQTVRATQQHWIGFEEKRSDAIVRETRMEWMGALNTIPGQQVVLTDEFVAHDLTVYTSHYPFFMSETHLYLMDNDTLMRRLAVQRALVPDFVYGSRALVGASALNQALHAQTLCRIQLLLFMRHEPCAYKPEDFLPERWHYVMNVNPTDTEILNTLKDAHVTQVMLKKIPAVIQPFIKNQRRVGGYALADVVW